MEPSPKHKSKKSKVPFFDETLVTDESKFPSRNSDKGLDSSPNGRSSDKVGEIINASGKKRVDLSDSSDDENHPDKDPSKLKKDGNKSFDALLFESPITNKKAKDVAKVIFNKDSDEESDPEKAHADIDDLMGESEDEKSKAGDDDWDLENV